MPAHLEATGATLHVSGAEMVALSKRHTFFSWSAQGAVDPIPMVRGEGIYFWDADGKRYIDLNSQLMCVNIGHGDRRVIDAIKAQAEELVYAGPGMATRVRAEIGPLLAAVTPGDLDTFFFTLGGAEANENAIRLARAYTGRHKIVTRYRSYHGATAGRHRADRRPASLGERARVPGRGARLRPVPVPEPPLRRGRLGRGVLRRSAWPSWRRPSCTRGPRRWPPSSSRR